MFGRLFLPQSSAGILTLLWLTSTLMAATPKAGDKLDFNRDIRPILSTKCYHCHGADEGSRKAKLRLDIRTEALKERKGSIAIVPGKLDQSDLYARITTKDPDEIMPPPKEAHPLTGAEVNTLKRWIEQGAPYAQHWAFEKPVKPALPSVKQKAWPRNGVDNFILAKLEQAGIKPSPLADRHLLIRRVTLDLTGLPPTPEEVDAFVKDKSPHAYEQLVDRLLQSPAYGERWARMWLDLARYADSAGYGSDPLRLNIWPYRDWVIKAFNQNIPYDQFTIEQIAGDLLKNPTEEQLVATAFHRNTMTNTEGGTDDEEFRVAAVKDRISTTMEVWMGLTMGCAQCHSHKFDPISQQEYYRFFAIFNQTEDNDQPDERPTMPLPTKAEQEKMARIKSEIAGLKKQLDQATPELTAEQLKWEKEQAQTVDWVTLEPSEFTSSGGALLTRQADQSLLVSGKLADKEIYTVKAKTDLKGITAVRLELLPDESLPQKGPGRNADGNAVLTQIQLSVQPVQQEVKRARFVRLEIPGKERILSLAEVEVFSGGRNVALQGKASQSSTSNDAPASLAIDGKTDGNFYTGHSVTHTATEENPWWELDLGSEQPVDEIVIWNRTDGGVGTRLANFNLIAINSDHKLVWQTKVKSPPSPNAKFNLHADQAVVLQNASADYQQGGFEVDKAIDADKKTGWGLGGQIGKAHQAIFETVGQVGGDGGSLLTFKLAHEYGKEYVSGHFRLSVTTHAKPVRVLPADVSAILAVDAAMRTHQQQDTLAAYFRTQAPALAKTRQELAKFEKELATIKPVDLPVMRELPGDKQRISHILVKGNFLIPGDEVKPGLPEAFNPEHLNGSLSRLDVANWLLSRDNPLTARVAVNRFWAQLFGVGIVETEEDFGTQGALPTHPELLDWLATEFMDHGWNVKGMIKTLVMSATYQQSSQVTPKLLEKDPRDRLLSRYPRRRLDADGVRDQALALSGLLSHKLGGPSVYPPQPDGLWRAAFNGQRSWATSMGEDRYRRGLYTFWRRTVPYPSMSTFDAPSRENCTLRRLPTNTPLQAFVTLNDPAYVEMSQALGRRIVREGGLTVEDRLRYGLKLCLGRPPTKEQVKALVSLYDQELANYRTDANAAKQMATEPLGALPAGADAAESAAWTVIANVLLNLDGVLTKG